MDGSTSLLLRRFHDVREMPLLHSFRQNPGIRLEKANLDHNASLAPVRRGHDHMDDTCETGIRNGIQLNFTGWPALIRPRLDSDTSASTAGSACRQWSLRRFGIGSRAERVTISPISAFFVSTTASKGPDQGIIEATVAPLRTAVLAPIAAFAAATAACARL